MVIDTRTFSIGQQKQKMIDLDKCCDFILKNKITPNMDGIY